MNNNCQVTSFLDGSAVYGSSEEESHLLRKFIGGELLTQKGKYIENCF